MLLTRRTRDVKSYLASSCNAGIIADISSPCSIFTEGTVSLRTKLSSQICPGNTFSQIIFVCAPSFHMHLTFKTLFALSGALARQAKWDKIGVIGASRLVGV